MAEILKAIGAIKDAVRIPRSGDSRRKPEHPLSYEERHRFEEDCNQIVQKEDFGREDFGNFCRSMVVLARQEGNPKGFARLRDGRAELNINFNENGISIRGHPVATADPSVLEAGFYQDISYRPQKTDYSPFGDKHSDFQPILITHDRVPIPSSIEYFSYFKEKSESAFPEGAHYVRKEEKVTDKDVQDFCKRVYSVYTLSKLGLNFPPR